MSASPDPGLVELSNLLVGTWRVQGPDIDGEARYRTVRDGQLLVGDVEVRVAGTPMRNLQHIAHDPGSGTLRARYMDTYGDEEIYTWVLERPHLRVTPCGSGSGTYFEAVVATDGSSYAGRWREADPTDGADPPEEIVYTRIEAAG